MNTLLAKLFQFFKTKNPKLYALFIAIIAAVWILQGQGIIHLPQAVVDGLIGLGLVTGTHTAAIVKEDNTKP